MLLDVVNSVFVNVPSIATTLKLAVRNWEGGGWS